MDLPGLENLVLAAKRHEDSALATLIPASPMSVSSLANSPGLSSIITINREYSVLLPPCLPGIRETPLFPSDKALAITESDPADEVVLKALISFSKSSSNSFRIEVQHVYLRGASALRLDIAQ